jgi:hypothetical protein
MKLSIGFLTLFALLSFTPPAPAQSVHLDVDTQLRPIDHELDSIDAESTAATVLYVTGTIVMLTGAGIAIGGAVAQSSPFIHGADDHETISAGIGIGAVGLLALGLAIGLDVDSGSRRRAHATRVALAPSVGGATLSVSGTF